VDVGRDLIDHRMVDLEGHDVGRVDDVWIHVADGAAVASPIVTGTGALLRQLGRVGERIRRLARRAVVDVRTTLPDPDPAVLGLLVAPHPLRRTLGLKRFDSTSQRFGGTRRHTRYLAWTADVEIRDGAIHCPVPFTDLPLLSAAAPSVPPPMPDQADAP
jgi:hypothetical protein